MKIKVSELQGAALDWAVAKCEGFCLPLRITIDYEEQWAFHPYSTDWAHGGPIIEREKYELRWLPRPQEWCAYRIQHGIDGHVVGSGFGKTALEASMRCYVASKLCDEVDVPDELVG